MSRNTEKKKCCLSDCECDDLFSLMLRSRLSALFTSSPAFFVFSAVDALVLGLEALRTARSTAWNLCFLTASHTVACCSRLAPLTRAYQPAFTLFAAFRFEYKVQFLFVLVFCCCFSSCRPRLRLCTCALGRLPRQNFTPHLNTKASSIKQRRH